MDLDPGQPNYNLAGQIALVKVKDLILTNSDFHDVQILAGYYLNSPTPNLNMKYYN
jgi:polynucleotide 5'-kinase involved in rRNA processing